MKALSRMNAGFTLVEVMIAVVVLAILASLALPSYNDFVMRGQRANARAALLQATQWMERTATARGSYPLAAAIPQGVLLVEGSRYNIAAASNDGLTFNLTATPIGAQANDRCGAYRINQAGTRSQVPTAEVPVTLGPLECWSR